MEVMNVLIRIASVLFCAGLLTFFAEIAVQMSEDKEESKREKTRRLYLFIIFVMALFWVGEQQYQSNKRHLEELREKELYVSSIIEDAESVEDIEDAWNDREWYSE